MRALDVLLVHLLNINIVLFDVDYSDLSDVMLRYFNTNERGGVQQD